MGERVVQVVGTGVLIAIILIVILEICRFFRWIVNLPREIDNLKKKVSNIEEQLNNQSK
jgi:hypothetical protein